MRISMWIGAAAMAAVVATGCQSKSDRMAEQRQDQMENRADATDEQPTGSVSEKEMPGTDQPSDLNPMEAQSRIDEVRLGRQAGADNAVPDDAEENEFAPGDPVVLSMDVSETPPDSAVKVVWVGPDDARLGEEVQQVSPGALTLMFKAPDTSAWKVDGDYEVEIYLADEKVGSADFDIVQPSDARR